MYAARGNRVASHGFSRHKFYSNSSMGLPRYPLPYAFAIAKLFIMNTNTQTPENKVRSYSAFNYSHTVAKQFPTWDEAKAFISEHLAEQPMFIISYINEEFVKCYKFSKTKAE